MVVDNTFIIIIIIALTVGIPRTRNGSFSFILPAFILAIVIFLFVIIDAVGQTADIDDDDEIL